MENKQSAHIVLNRGYCEKCKGDLVSEHRHHFVKCECESSYLDGGLDYIRAGGHLISTAVYDNDPFEIVRQHMYRGGRGKDGQGEFRYTKLMNMDNDYLQALLDYEPCPEWQKSLVQKEIEYRKSHI